MKLVKIGAFFPNDNESVADNIKNRLLSGPEVREDWYGSKRRIRTPGFEKVRSFVSGQFGNAKVYLSFNRYAGCSCCPCSPGFNVLVKSTPENASLILRYTQYHRPRRNERWAFFEDEAGKITIRCDFDTHWNGFQI